LFKTLMHRKQKPDGTENKPISISTNGTSADSPLTGDLTMNLTEEVQTKLWHQEELIKTICLCIKDCYPQIKRLNVAVKPKKVYRGDGNYDTKQCIYITWEDGISECRMSQTIACVLEEYFNAAATNINKKTIQIKLKRNYSNEALLAVSRKYANCIAPNLPLNMHNIHCFKVGGVPVYDLAFGELELMDEVKL
jgi:hypothetical protein